MKVRGKKWKDQREKLDKEETGGKEIQGRKEKG
jgi:hypothetical protein